jgi:2'-5' RNA ligase
MPAYAATPEGPRQRAFFALWPSVAATRALARHAVSLAHELDGRATRTASIHLTLAFLGDVPAAALERVMHPPARVCVPPFDLVLDRLGAWDHNGIGWAAPSAPPEALLELQRRLADWLGGSGFRLEARPARDSGALRPPDHGGARHRAAGVAGEGAEAGALGPRRRRRGLPHPVAHGPRNASAG